MIGSRPKLTPAVPPGQRYSCRQCGWCCRWWKVQVAPEERNRLLAHDWAAESPRLAGVQLFWEHREPEQSRPAIQTAQIRRQCVFLEEDGLCIIHKVLGEHAKPATCRRFPFIAGFIGCEPLVSMDYSCSSVVRNEGEPVQAMEEEASLWLAEAARSLHYEPEPLPVLVGGIEMRWRAYLALEDALLGIVDRRGTPFKQRLAAGDRLISDLATRVQNECVISETQAEERLRSFFSNVSRETASRGTSDRSVLPSMGHLAAMIADVEVPHSPTTGRGSTALGKTMTIAAQRGQVYLSTIGAELDLEKAGTVTCNLDLPEFDDCLTRFVSSYVLGKALLKSATVMDGWNYLATCLGLIHWYASASAAVCGRTTADLEDVTTGVQVVGKAFVP